MNTKRKIFIKEWGISIITFALAISIFLGSAAYLQPYLTNATEATSEGIEIITTSNSNIEFSTYFINENGEKVKTLNTEIDKNTYLYVDITVLNEGYFNGAITLDNNNFKFVEDDENEGASEINENAITLEQIGAGETKTIKVAVESIIEDTITLNNLETETEVTLSGEYVNSKNIEKNKYEEIIGTGSVELRWVSSSEISTEINTKLLTNSVYEIEEQEKRIVQVLVNSKIADNSYPVYSSSIKLTVPENVEEIAVSARSTEATNSNIEFGTENYTYNEQDGIVEIIIQNTDTENISWNKEGYDTFVITYVFDANQYIEEGKIDVSSEITSYDSKELTAEESVELKQTENLDGVITYNVSAEDTSIYKGNLYAGEDKEYSVTNEINVNYLNVVDSVVLNCNEATYLAGEQEGSANIVYTASKINKEKFLEIFGEDGYLIFKDENGNEITITSETQADEEGNITINFDAETKSIEIKTSEPKTIGTLKIEHTKKIKNTGYTRETINAMTGIKETITGRAYAKWTEDVDEITEETKITLEETETDASLKIDTSTISTTADSQTITLCAILDSSDETKNLYKNPTVTITLPEEIDVISAQYAVICKNGLTVGEKSIKENENGQYEITINLQGEQVEYDTSRGGTRIYFKLEIATSTLTPTKLDTIEMAYTNEYTNEVKTESTEINFESQYGLMIYNQLTNYSENGEKLVTIDKEIATATIEKNAESKEVNIGTAIINNYGTEISNVEIIGSVPAEENSTFLSTINSVATDKEGIEILYSTKADITADDESWGEYTENSVSYKITIEKMEAEEVIKLTVTSSIPADLNYNAEGYFKTTTVCTYNKQQEENTSTMLLATDKTDAIINQTTTESGLDVEIAAYLGNTSISEEDAVYEGETIRYEVTITNNTGVDYTNVEISAEQTNGYVYDYITEEVYNYYYEYEPDLAQYDETHYKISEYNQRAISTIESFSNGESYTFEYETSTYMLDNESIEGTETYGTISVNSDSDSFNEKIETIRNEIVDAELQVNIINYFTTDVNYGYGGTMETSIEITNLTENTLENIELEAVFSNYLEAELTTEDEENFTLINTSEAENGETTIEYKITELEAGETFEIFSAAYSDTSIEEESVDLWYVINATTESGNVYSSNKEVRKFEDYSHNIDVEQEGNYEDGTKIVPEQDVLIDGENISITATIVNNEETALNLDIDYEIDTHINIETATITSLNYNNNSIIENFNSVNNLSMSQEEVPSNDTIKIEITGTINSFETDSIETVLSIYDNDTHRSVSDTFSVKVETVSDDNDTNDNTDDNTDNSEEDNNVLYEEDPEEDPEEEKETNYDNSNNQNEENTYDDINNQNEDNTEENSINDNINDENNTEENSTNDNNKNESNIEGNNIGVNNTDDNNTEENNKNKDNTNNSDVDNTEEINTYTVSGTVWLDTNKDGVMDSSEEKISDLEVLAINASSKETTGTALTDSSGEYEFTLDEGNYIIVFLYDNTLYTVTTYQSSENSSTNSDALEESIEIDGNTKTAGVTDTIILSENITNINMGLVTKETFDLNISKYVNKITINNESGTKEYEQSEGTTLAKAEIKSKYINNSIVEIEYKIKITNSGEVAGYANTIVDKMPSGLEFDETLNSGWYLEDGILYNTSLANEKIEPGETKELTLILTKTMTESNTGLVNNSVEIESSSNDLGIDDATENSAQANVIISLSTGAVKYAIGTIIALLIIGASVFVINKKILHKRI